MKVVINILTEQGRAAIQQHLKEEAKYKEAHKHEGRLNFYFNTKSKLYDDRLEITDFKHFGSLEKNFFKNNTIIIPLLQQIYTYYIPCQE